MGIITKTILTHTTMFSDCSQRDILLRPGTVSKCSEDNKTIECDILCDTGKVAATDSLDTLTSFTCGPESDYLWRQTREITPCSGTIILCSS